MNDLKEKTIAALAKQVELLCKDGVSPGEMQNAVSTVSALTGLLSVLGGEKRDAFTPANQKAESVASQIASKLEAKLACRTAMFRQEEPMLDPLSGLTPREEL